VLDRARQPAPWPPLPSSEWIESEVSELAGAKQALSRVMPAPGYTISLAAHHETPWLTPLMVPAGAKPKLSRLVLSARLPSKYPTAPPSLIAEPGQGHRLAEHSLFVGEYATTRLAPCLEFSNTIEANERWLKLIVLGTAATAAGPLTELLAFPTGVSQGGQGAKTDSDESLRNDFASAFQVDPECAVDGLVAQLKTQPNGGLAAARVTLPYLVRASYAQQN